MNLQENKRIENSYKTYFQELKLSSAITFSLLSQAFKNSSKLSTMDLPIATVHVSHVKIMVSIYYTKHLLQ